MVLALEQTPVAQEVIRVREKYFDTSAAESEIRRRLIGELQRNERLPAHDDGPRGELSGHESPACQFPGTDSVVHDLLSEAYMLWVHYNYTSRSKTKAYSSKSCGYFAAKRFYQSLKRKRVCEPTTDDMVSAREVRDSFDDSELSGTTGKAIRLIRQRTPVADVASLLGVSDSAIYKGLSRLAERNANANATDERELAERNATRAARLARMRGLSVAVASLQAAESCERDARLERPFHHADTSNASNGIDMRYGPYPLPVAESASVATDTHISPMPAAQPADIATVDSVRDAYPQFVAGLRFAANGYPLGHASRITGSNVKQREPKKSRDKSYTRMSRRIAKTREPLPADLHSVELY